MKFALLILATLLNIQLLAQNIGLTNNTSERISSSGNCSFSAISYTEANAGTFGSISCGISGEGFGVRNGETRTAGLFGGLISMGNWTPVETKVNGYPLSYNVIHTYSGASAPWNRRLYEVASCADNTGGGGSGSDEDCEGGSEIFTFDPLNQDPCDSPILIDIAGDSIECGGEENILTFDLWGSGNPVSIQWVAPNNDDVFLVHDINDNHNVDDGRELFGSGTQMLIGDDELANNGFVGLAQFDHKVLGGNGDGFITQEDEVWNRLKIWNDRNANGISEPGELDELNHSSIDRLDTIPKERRYFDEHGNWFRFWASAKAGQVSHIMIDVFFKRHTPGF